MNNQQNESPEMELTPEELAARKEEMKQFYEDSLPYLEAQSKYETLLTTIEEARFKRAQFQYQFSIMMAQMQGQEGMPEQEEETKKAPAKKLKKN